MGTSSVGLSQSHSPVYVGRGGSIPAVSVSAQTAPGPPAKGMTLVGCAVPAALLLLVIFKGQIDLFFCLSKSISSSGFNAI